MFCLSGFGSSSLQQLLPSLLDPSLSQKGPSLLVTVFGSLSLSPMHQCVHIIHWSLIAHTLCSCTPCFILQCTLRDKNKEMWMCRIKALYSSSTKLEILLYQCPLCDVLSLTLIHSVVLHRYGRGLLFHPYPACFTHRLCPFLERVLGGEDGGGQLSLLVCRYDDKWQRILVEMTKELCLWSNRFEVQTKMFWS